MENFETLRQWLSSYVGDGRRFKKRSDLARFLGLSRTPTQLYEVLKGERTPNADVFIEWVVKLGGRILPPEDFESVQEHYYPVPKVLPRIKTGSREFDDKSKVQGIIAFRYKWLSHYANPQTCVVFEMFESSMAPTLNAGDHIMVDQSKTEILSGKIYAIGIEDTVCVKRIEKRPGSLVLRNDNPTFEKEEISGSSKKHVAIIGQAIWASKML